MSLSMEETLQVFAEESSELLELAEHALLNLEDQPDNQEQVDELFRAFHTIKGAAGVFGLDRIVAFTHVAESVLSMVREGLISVDSDLVGVFLSVRDYLAQLVDHELGGGGELSPEMQSEDDALVAKLALRLGDKGDDESPEEHAQDDAAMDDGEHSHFWHISLRFRPDALRHGMDPASFLGYLGNLGELVSLVLIDDALPPWTEYEPESCHLGFEIDLLADTTKEAIEEVFEFVQDDCEVSILPPGSQIEAYVALIKSLPEDEQRIGEILCQSKALTERELREALAEQSRAGESDGARRPLGQVAVEQRVIQQPVVKAAVEKQKEIKTRAQRTQQTVRVSATKLESLVNLVGELVIGGANADLLARKTADDGLIEAMENISHLIEEVRDTTLGLRMVQIGETFSRFRRVVREVSKSLGKEIDLRISGGETELDKTVIEKIGDPLMHLVRNAIDHGIESPEEREAAGKSSSGEVHLQAYHDSGSIVIQISDDGRGLSRKKLEAKAIEQGLIDADNTMKDAEIYRLIFEPGFSTAEEVSDISGRGVGMDVVRRNIDALRGQVDIESEPGNGSTITVRLPLTLAIIDGFQVQVDDAQFIIPLDMVVECVELTDTLRNDSNGSDYVSLRGEVLPYVCLGEMFGGSRSQGGSRRDNIIVVQYAGKRAGLVVDDLLGEHQTVIKPLGHVFQHLKGISGATILGSGEVAMIVDVQELVQRAMAASTSKAPAAAELH